MERVLAGLQHQAERHRLRVRGRQGRQPRVRNVRSVIAVRPRPTLRFGWSGVTAACRARCRARRTPEVAEAVADTADPAQRLWVAGRA